MGRMEGYKRDAYHVGKHSRPTPRLAHVIFYLFILVYIFDLLVAVRFFQGFLSFLCVSLNYLEFAVLCWNTCFVNKGKVLPAV